MKYHAPDLATVSDTASALGPVLPDLFRDTASEQKRKVQVRLNDVVEIWQQEAYVPKEMVAQLRDSLSDPTATASTPRTANFQSSTTSEDLPFLMPSTHGDPSLPFYELPAGNFMPHILPNRGASMRAESIQALQLAAGPADQGLVNAVKDFLKDVAQIDEPLTTNNEGMVPDVDDLGQLSYYNEDRDQKSDTYYGWSRAFCEKMKARRNPETNGSRRISNSRSRSSPRSESPRRKRRYSHSSSDRSKSRSSPKPRYRGRRFSEDSSRSPSPPAAFRPMQSIDPPSVPNVTPGQQQQRVLPMYNHGPQFAPPPLLPGHMPVPPPRPPNWPVGSPWPPPPPPPLSHMGGNSFARAPFPPPSEYQGRGPGSGLQQNKRQPPYFGR